MRIMSDFVSLFLTFIIFAFFTPPCSVLVGAWKMGSGDDIPLAYHPSMSLALDLALQV